jgi:hypothetical protein
MIGKMVAFSFKILIISLSIHLSFNCSIHVGFICYDCILPCLIGGIDWMDAISTRMQESKIKRKQIFICHITLLKLIFMMHVYFKEYVCIFQTVIFFLFSFCFGVCVLGVVF